MSHTFSDPDLAELDRIWPLGQQLKVKEGGTIVVAGAYEGRYMAYLAELFPTSPIRGYEPQHKSFYFSYLRFKNDELIRVTEAALGTAKRKMVLGNAGTDGATLVSRDGAWEDVQVLDAVDELHSYKYGIQLLLLNAEGSEWTLIPYLLNEMMHHRIASMAIQFHPKYVSNHHCDRVLSQIREYYDQVYFDWPYWTYWRRKG